MQVIFNSFIGNETVKERLYRTIQSGRASHAYLLEGRAGSGKKTLAYHITAALNCENTSDTVPCGSCLTCRKIYRGISPDVVYTSLDKKAKSIGVEKIRQMLEHVQVAPNDLQMKVYIIDHAHKLTEQAQNTLLKLMEEPPGRALFLLLCENSSMLLPTVRSRTQQLRMELFSDETLYEYVMENEPLAESLQRTAPERLMLLLRLSNGTIGSAKRYLSYTEDKLEADPQFSSYQMTEETLKILCGDMHAGGGRSVSLILALSERIRDRDQAGAYLDKLAAMARDILCVKKGLRRKLLFFLNEEDAEQAALHFTEAGISGLLTSVIQSKQSLSANPNLQILLQKVCYSALGALA